MKNLILLKLITYQYTSEKCKNILEKNNILVFKVDINTNKINIKNYINCIFKLKIKKINTVIIKKKYKIKKSNSYKTKLWKKAFIILKSNKDLIYINKLDNLNLIEKNE